MANCVRELGPLWVQSTFAFKTNNRVLVRSNWAKRYFLHNTFFMSWKYVVKLSLDKNSKEIDHSTFLGEKSTVRINSDECENLEFNFDSHIQLYIKSYHYVKRKLLR